MSFRDILTFAPAPRSSWVAFFERKAAQEFAVEHDGGDGEIAAKVFDAQVAPDVSLPKGGPGKHQS